MNSNEPVAMTVKTFAERLSVSESHVWMLLRTGEVKAIRLGRRTLVPTSELVRVLAKAGVIDGAGTETAA